MSQRITGVSFIQTGVAGAVGRLSLGKYVSAASSKPNV